MGKININQKMLLGILIGIILALVGQYGVAKWQEKKMRSEMATLFENYQEASDKIAFLDEYRKSKHPVFELSSASAREPRGKNAACASARARTQEAMGNWDAYRSEYEPTEAEWNDYYYVLDSLVRFEM